MSSNPLLLIGALVLISNSLWPKVSGWERPGMRWLYWILQAANLGAGLAVLYGGIPGLGHLPQIGLLRFVVAMLYFYHILQNHIRLGNVRRDEMIEERMEAAEINKEALIAELRSRQEEQEREADEREAREAEERRKEREPSP